jgi:hypothetical protein
VAFFSFSVCLLSISLFSVPWTRVARWYFSNQKSQVWVNFGECPAMVGVGICYVH